jgi:hypothetical protein
MSPRHAITTLTSGLKCAPETGASHSIKANSAGSQPFTQ